MRRLVIPVLALIVMGASACGGWRQDDAAQVNGVDIDADRLQADTRALLDQPSVAEVFLGSGASLSPLGGAGDAGAPEGRLPTAALSSMLDRRIIQVLAEGELAARGLEVTEADLTSAQAVIRDELTAAQPSAAQPPAAAGSTGQPPDPAAAFDSLPEGLRGRLVRGDAVVTRLRRDLAAGQLDDFPGDAQAWYRANQDQFVEFCLSVVPVADEAEGRRLAAESASGQAGLADLVTRQGGQEAGCGLGFQLREQLRAELAEALEAATVGRAVGPFPATDGSQILVGVSSRTQKPFTEVEAEAAQRYEAERSRLEDGPWEEWLATQQPEVSIDPRYGTWDAENKTVRPPEGTLAPSQGVAP
jgi:hypothetical protein